jgi:hypothetical protein
MGVTLILTMDSLFVVFTQGNDLVREGDRLFVGFDE